MKLRSFKAFPYGLLSIATYLRKKISDKVNVQLFDCNIDSDKDFVELLKQKLSELKPDVVGISMMFDNSYKHLSDISAIIKNSNNKTIVVLGGLASISSAEFILNEQKNVDAICYYEGEKPLLKLIESEQPISHLECSSSWITRKSIIENRIYQKDSVLNLDEVVAIDYSFVDIELYAMREGFSPFVNIINNKKQFFLVTSRGCPFRCTFCMHSSDSDKSMRYASVEAIIKHVEFLVSALGMNVLTIYDDQILLNRERAKQLFKEFSRFNIRIECPNGLSVAFMDDELIGFMRSAGMDTVSLAIESGSPYVLNNLMHKPLRIEMVKPIVESLRKHDFWIQGYFVSGLPGEDDTHREETVKFIKEVGLDWSGFSLAVPIKGSELYKNCIENGFIEEEKSIKDLYFNKYIIKTPKYSPEYVTKKTYQMNLDVNFVNNYRMKKGDYKTASDAFKDVIARYENHAFAYYYLSKALTALKDQNGTNEAFGKYCQIIDESTEWKEYAEHFNLK